MMKGLREAKKKKREEWAAASAASEELLLSFFCATTTTRTDWVSTAFDVDDAANVADSARA